MGAHVDSLAGFACRESDISHLRFEVTRGVALEEGHLVAAHPQSAAPVLFQLTNGVLHEEPGLESGERTFVVGEAQQLGTWDEGTQGFVSYPWVVPENAPIFRHSSDARFQRTIRPDHVDIGTVPSSGYPVNISVTDLVLYHSAILGVTGSGKSFLAYHLIESCAKSGIKVLCLDLTGDHKRYVTGALRIKTAADITPFLEQTAVEIGIIEFTEGGAKHPITSTKEISEQALSWCKATRKDDEIRDPKPKVLLVLEEAHSLVPEWNSNPVRSLQDTVNVTAQTVLQARKYGLGFMVISQRTANVTKSIWFLTRMYARSWGSGRLARQW